MEIGNLFSKYHSIINLSCIEHRMINLAVSAMPKNDRQTHYFSLFCHKSLQRKCVLNHPLTEKRFFLDFKLIHVGFISYIISFSEHDLPKKYLHAIVKKATKMHKFCNF